MVRVVELIAFSNLAFGAIASCHRYAVSLQPFDLAGCDGHDLHDKLTLKEGQCRDSHIHDPFFSFNLGPYEPGKKGHDLNAIPYPCKVWWYDAPDCKGSSGHTDDLHKPGEFDKCHSTGFTQNGTLPHGARAVRLHCEKPKKSKSQSHMVPAATVADFVYTTTIHTKIPVLISSSTSGTVQSSTVCKNITKTETVTWKPSSTVVSGSTKSVVTASVKKTTTIIAPPTATVEGTTTVWVAPTSSSKSTRTQTWVATIADAAHPDAVKRAIHEASLAHEAAQPAKSPASVIHPSSDSIECYISQDGHWLISTCSATTAAPARTSSATKSTKATKSSMSKSRTMTRTATLTPTRTATPTSNSDDDLRDVDVDIDCVDGVCYFEIDGELTATYPSSSSVARATPLAARSASDGIVCTATGNGYRIDGSCSGAFHVDNLPTSVPKGIETMKVPLASLIEAGMPFFGGNGL
ncbi:hypothetical protein C1H76_4823 [Elsinoe australis]|uniref:Uncharacterized protein n=1 Tax=Elsinoe australis TaxID=40998 RepID=A0A4U7AX14_9PEZI|nr:hypothetical protein C1H76_4823 [Elsinoe australis]